MSLSSLTWTTTATVTGTADGLDCDALTVSETAGPNGALANPCCQGWAADPVNTWSGNLHEQYTDLALGGRGPAVAWSRAYNSSAAGVEGPLGWGWTVGWGARLTEAGGGATATIAQENGATVTFTRLADGTYAAPSRVTATLAAVAGGGWVFKRGLGEDVLTFDGTGRLLSQADRNGETVTLGYSGGRLTTITGSAGRTLTIGWNTAGDRITSVTGPGSPARSVTYD